jgi:hypothetical protein
MPEACVPAIFLPQAHVLTRDKQSLVGMVVPGQIGGISTKAHGATAYRSAVGPR